MTCRKRRNKTYHLTSNLLPHGALPCENWMFNSATSFNANVMQNHLFTVGLSAYQRCFMCLSRLIYNVAACAKLVWFQKTRMLWVVNTAGQWMRRWRVVKTNTHRRRRSDETVWSRRVGGVYMNSQLAHDDCRRIRPCEWSQCYRCRIWRNIWRCMFVNIRICCVV